MLIFPAIDLREGRVVRLTHGDYGQQTTYAMSPVEAAMEFERQGAEWIHVVDLDGAKAGEPRNLEAIQAIASAVQIPIQVGGGLRSRDSILQVIEAGASRVILGSRIASDLDWAATTLAEFGDTIVAGIDARDGMVAVSGWTETSSVSAESLARTLTELGARRFVFTDIARDGALIGPNLEALNTFIEAAGVPVIASGGVANLADVTALRQTATEGVIIGKALYEGRFTLSQALVGS